MRPAWQVREHAGVTSWYQVRLAFPDGARVDALAVVSGGGVSIEDVQAQPALSLADLAALADWIQGPLSEACGVRTEGAGERCPGGGREGRPEGADERCSEASGPAPEVVGEEGPYAGARPCGARAPPPRPRGPAGRPPRAPA
ncbi:DUF6214 family protein [Streptomyces sp. NPDC052301]|uniref:DUF6214 family protein n=1 Tax=Streptomyces sp. NPDC052301 TaxID=3365687 RepID=UPI0037D31AB8